MTVEGTALGRLAPDLAQRSRYEHSCTSEVGKLLAVLIRTALRAVSSARSALAAGWARLGWSARSRPSPLSSPSNSTRPRRRQSAGSSWTCRTCESSPANFGSPALFLEDEVRELLTKVRAGMDVVGLDIDLIQVLEPEDVAVEQLGYDAAEEKAEFIQACPGAVRSRMGERQVNVNTVDAMQAKFP